ncbi:hypothetical protein SKAU_G00391960 [Synaphobranchus kaupii]|uniref:Uncharacterized protein n=1 Tax=Synaphobranchus kaupii TaxID=118154 RepID=A0A9Q1EBM5_SYNKA|nr:hypothetical protein SKAU_G00391960 [Synaphobranchus kaupii]
MKKCKMKMEEGTQAARKTRVRAKRWTDRGKIAKEVAIARTAQKTSAREEGLEEEKKRMEEKLKERRKGKTMVEKMVQRGGEILMEISVEAVTE